MSEIERKTKKWTTEQKWGAAILTFFGIIVLIFGFWQFLYRVKSPFFSRGTGLKNFKDLDQQRLERILAKQKKDTDSDGLTDFDEEYVYKTSPYLDDSDSDGFLDKEEIDSGNDPNCPAGKTCGLSSEMVASSGSTVGTSGVNFETATGINPDELTKMQALLSGQATPEAVRASLLQAGVNEAILSQIDDKTLMGVYQEVLKETNASASLQNLNLSSNINILNTNFNANVSNPFLTALTPTEVRALFQQAGMDVETLNKIDDATLMKLFEEAIK